MVLRSMSLDEENLSSYVAEIRNIPTLTKDEEFILAKKWKENGDIDALNKIVNSHLKLVYKIAKGYSGYGLPLSDLVAEGNLGIMHAVQHFDPSIGYRFSTYAIWWIKAKMQEFIYNSWSIVKLSSSKNNKKLFFGFRKLKKLLGIESLSEDNVNDIAEKMKVSVEDVKIAETRFSHRDFSVNTSISEEKEKSWIDFLEDTKNRPDTHILDDQEYSYRKKLLHDALNTLSKKEYDVICLYRLSNPTKSLREVGEILNLSAERVRQLEKQAFLKIQNYIKKVTKKKVQVKVKQASNMILFILT